VPLDNDRVLYYVVLAVFVAVFLFIIRIVHSPYGQVLKAIRENEPRAISPSRPPWPASPAR
jgi:branched-chain amino acid transport system permease protein